MVKDKQLEPEFRGKITFNDRRFLTSKHILLSSVQEQKQLHPFKLLTHLEGKTCRLTWTRGAASQEAQNRRK